MRQGYKPCNGIVLDYSCPAPEAALLRQLLAENEMLTDFEVETARLDKVVPASRPEFTETQSGVVESSYLVVLDDSRRKRRAS